MLKFQRQEVYNLFDKRVDEYLSINVTKFQEKINCGKIEFNCVIHYDGEFLWIDYRPHVRLTLLDGENKLIVADSVIPREFFSKDFIKDFLKISLENLEFNTIITDGYRAMIQ